MNWKGCNRKRSWSNFKTLSSGGTEENMWILVNVLVFVNKLIRKMNDNSRLFLSRSSSYSIKFIQLKMGLW
jgi:hypothetical protein